MILLLYLYGEFDSYCAEDNLIFLCDFFDLTSYVKVLKKLDIWAHRVRESTHTPRVCRRRSPA